MQLINLSMYHRSHGLVHLNVPRLVSRAADQLRWAWTHTVEPRPGSREHAEVDFWISSPITLAMPDMEGYRYLNFCMLTKKELSEFSPEKWQSQRSVTTTLKDGL